MPRVEANHNTKKQQAAGSGSRQAAGSRQQAAGSWQLAVGGWPRTETVRGVRLQPDSQQAAGSWRLVADRDRRWGPASAGFAGSARRGGTELPWSFFRLPPITLYGKVSSAKRDDEPGGALRDVFSYSAIVFALQSSHQKRAFNESTMKTTAIKDPEFLLLLAFVVTALLAGTPARAQEPDKTAEIDKIFSWATPTMPGCAVAVSHEGKLVVNRAYGLADLERNVPITSDTIFDAASVVKQFVAAATLILVEEGRLSLTEDIRKYIPELPDYGHKITLDHLMTHTSGIRDWTGLAPLTGRNVDALTLTLRQRGLDFAPGEEWSYSNSGYVLLKEIDRDTFQYGGMILRFHRDKAGKVMTLDYSNPAVRNIGFTRLSDGTGAR